MTEKTYEKASELKAIINGMVILDARIDSLTDKSNITLFTNLKTSNSSSNIQDHIQDDLFMNQTLAMITEDEVNRLREFINGRIISLKKQLEDL